MRVRPRASVRLCKYALRRPTSRFAVSMHPFAETFVMFITQRAFHAHVTTKFTRAFGRTLLHGTMLQRASEQTNTSVVRLRYGGDAMLARSLSLYIMLMALLWQLCKCVNARMPRITQYVAKPTNAHQTIRFFYAVIYRAYATRIEKRFCARRREIRKQDKQRPFNNPFDTYIHLKPAARGDGITEHDDSYRVRKYILHIL